MFYYKYIFRATVARACSKTATGCSNEILTDWFTTGDQTQTIRRGCLEEPISEQCSEGASDRIMVRSRNFEKKIIQRWSNKTYSGDWSL